MTLSALVLALALGVAPWGQDPPPPPPADGAEAVASEDGAVVQTQAPGPPPPAPPLPAVPDAADTLRALGAPAVLDAYRADPAFQYENPEAEGPSLWDRFWDWVDRVFWDPIQEGTSAGFREWVLIALGVLALGWAAARLLQAGGVGVFVRSDRPRGAAGPLLDVEDIAEVDLDTRLARALGAGDHREAIRVRYLRLLQALDAAGTLAWRRDKTNRQYVAEVGAADPARVRPFRRATRAFEAVWYGERPVSKALYARLAPVFDAAQPVAARPARAQPASTA